jgi:hypothetical protein
MFVRDGALPLGQQIALDLVAPPIITAIWWLLARGWAQSLGTTDWALRWQKPATLAVLIAAYFIMFSITLYAYFT